MRVTRLLFFVSISFLLSISLAAQLAATQQSTPSVQRDPQAVTVLTQSIAAMGGSVPTDSVATGTVTLVAGSLTETGTIGILTRGVDQSSEQIQTPSVTHKIIYSRGQANDIHGTVIRTQLELAVSSQSPDFPLPLLAGALNNIEMSFQYVGLETLSGAPVHHIRFWNTFSEPWIQHLTEFSRKDLWLDAASRLPIRLSYEWREAYGAAPRISVDCYFSDYRNAGGALYPFLIKKSLNGTPWITITILNAKLNMGLSDADFPVLAR